MSLAPSVGRLGALGLASLTTALVLPLLATTGAGAAPGAPGAPASGSATGGPGCASLFAAPTRASSAAKDNPNAFGKAAAANGRSRASFESAAKDPAFWLDRCGRAFYVEEQASAAERTASAPTTAAAMGTGTDPVPLTETFTLESRPGSARTIYLDFTGETVTGTAWNQSYGSTIAVAPYSIDATATTDFSTAELTEIQRAWQIVAEDYAPFDVNVTTRDPGLAAIDRTSSSDLVYGTRVVFAGANPIYTSCGCGGVAYVNVFTTSGSSHLYYQPAWVFTQGVGTGGKNMAEAASHEAGHNFGLDHDGTATQGYYAGSAPWAPIMGVGYNQPVSQWSRGEYAGASSAQDDLAQIATGAPLRGDDHAATAATATALGTTPLDGVISTRTDVDAFRFVGAGATTLGVTGAAGLANLDVQLRVEDAAGTTVAVVDPAVARVSSSQATGLGATWTASLPADGATYTAYVDGTGIGDPLTAGRYSDYGSLGNFRISLATQTPSTPDPLVVTVTDAPAGRVGAPYDAAPVTASGGLAPYDFSATGLPAGLSIDAATGRVTGTPTTAGSTSPALTVRDALGASETRVLSLVVDPAPLSPVTVSDRSLSGQVGSPLSATLSASGGDGSYAWSASGLPAGVALSPSGALSGTPTTAGTYVATVTAVSAGLSGSGTLTVTVGAAPTAPLAITTTSLPAGKVRSAYSATILTSGGVPSYAWSIVKGSLPAGTTLTVAADGRSALVAGTPTTRAKSTFTVRVVDGTGAVVTRQLSINVNR